MTNSPWSLLLGFGCGLASFGHCCLWTVYFITWLLFFLNSAFETTWVYGYMKCFGKDVKKQK